LINKSVRHWWMVRLKDVYIQNLAESSPVSSRIIEMNEVSFRFYRNGNLLLRYLYFIFENILYC